MGEIGEQAGAGAPGPASAVHREKPQEGLSRYAPLPPLPSVEEHYSDEQGAEEQYSDKHCSAKQIFADRSSDNPYSEGGRYSDRAPGAGQFCERVHKAGSNGEARGQLAGAYARLESGPTGAEEAADVRGAENEDKMQMGSAAQYEGGSCKSCEECGAPSHGGALEEGGNP